MKGRPPAKGGAGSRGGKTAGSGRPSDRKPTGRGKPAAPRKRDGDKPGFKPRAPAAAKSAAAPLQALIAKDNAATDLAAACALASIAPGDARSAQLALPVLIAGVDADRAESRRAAAEALGKFGAAAASGLPALRYAAEDPDPGVRSAARDAIAQVEK